MLRSTKNLVDYVIRATDGTVGHVKDFYFDDERWVIRYLIVDTGTWLSSRKVLISPVALGEPDWTEKVFPVSITTAQVKDSPNIDTDKPVTRQHEIQYFGYYGYPFYWGGAGTWGQGLYPGTMLADSDRGGVNGESRAGHPPRGAEPASREEGDLHLRSCRAVTGYHIEARDGGIGHVEGFLVEERTWAIRYLIVDTSNWWLGHSVLIAPQWIRGVRWSDSTVSVNLTRQEVKEAPPYDPAVPLDRASETDIHEHYGRPGYWLDEGGRETTIEDTWEDEGGSTAPGAGRGLPAAPTLERISIRSASASEKPRAALSASGGLPHDGDDGQ